MPINKLLILRKAAEITEIMHRITMISDINAAFSGNTAYIDKLRKEFHGFMGDGLLEEMVGRPKDKNWKQRLLRYKR